MAGAPFISAHQLKLSFGPTQLFDGLSLTVHPGERWGVVGPNGAGKSTLLKILARQMFPDSGTVSSRSDVRMAYVTQKYDCDEKQSVKEILRDALPLKYRSDELRAMADKNFATHLSKAENDPSLYDNSQWMETLGVLQEKLDDAVGLSTDNLMVSLLKLGGLSEHADKKYHELSGGLQKRLQILAALLPNPQIILLDEPTNHLDVATVEWLEEFLISIAEEGVGFLGFRDLSSEPFSFVLVSHDRALLDTLVNKILEIDSGNARVFEGNFEQYSEQRFILAQQAGKAAEKAANLYKRELAWLRRGPAARTTKQQARIQRVAVISDDFSAKKAFAAPSQAAEINIQAELTSLGKAEDGSLVTKIENLGEQQLLVFKEVSMAHPDPSRAKTLLCKDLSLVVKPGTRLALLGPNGCGKSTLLNAMMNATVPLSGEINHHELTRISYFDQHRSALDPTSTVRLTVCPDGEYVFFGGKYLHLMGFLERFLFSKFDADRTVADLSGGEQARLLLAKLMLESGNLLILDEPTNDLDIPTLQTLEANLIAYKGGVIFTSHDRYFIERVATTVLSFEGYEISTSSTNTLKFSAQKNSWQTYPSLDQALNALDASKSSKLGVKNANSEKGQKIEPENVSKSAFSQTYSTKKLSWAQKQEFDALESKLPKLETDVQVLTTTLDRCYSEKHSFEEIQKVSATLSQKQAELDAASRKWEELYEIQNS